MIFLKVLHESFLMAIQQLVGHKLRSFLSLLGITIGIFCIIGVLSAVDSLEANIRSSFDKLGNDVVYLSKFYWGEDPEDNWWKYMRRPNPDIKDYQAIIDKSKIKGFVSFYSFIGARLAKYRSNSLERAFLFCATYDYDQIFKLQFKKGRYFSPAEYHYGSPKVVIGAEIAENLFGSIDPIGKQMKVSGKKVEVIGVLEKSGKDIISILNYDEAIIISYEFGKQLANLSPGSSMGGGIAIKAANPDQLDELKDEVTWIIRANRRLKPIEEDNFSLNTLSLMAKILDSFFGVLSVVGWIIGGFAIFVGMFSVANIMFVSVKERTNIVGIKKALGAKQFVILTEFLIEAIILCIIGGLIGLGIVWGGTWVISQALDFHIFLSIKNIVVGIGLSILIGFLAGLIPAFQAARMNPVDAIRSK